MHSLSLGTRQVLVEGRHHWTKCCCSFLPGMSSPAHPLSLCSGCSHIPGASSHHTYPSRPSPQKANLSFPCPLTWKWPALLLPSKAWYVHLCAYISVTTNACEIGAHFLSIPMWQGLGHADVLISVYLGRE